MHPVIVTTWPVCLCCCSLVCFGLWWSFLLHSDPAGAAGGFHSLLERVLAGQNGDRQLQRLVRRSVTGAAAQFHSVYHPTVNSEHDLYATSVSDTNLLCLLFLALVSVTIINYILSFTAVVLFFVFYTKPDGCFINKFFISFNMLFCVLVSVVSVLNKVQVDNHQWYCAAI